MKECLPDAVFSILGLDHVEPICFEQRSNRVATIRIVLDNQDRGFAWAGRSASVVRIHLSGKRDGDMTYVGMGTGMAPGVSFPDTMRSPRRMRDTRAHGNSHSFTASSIQPFPLHGDWRP